MRAKQREKIQAQIAELDELRRKDVNAYLESCMQRSEVRGLDGKALADWLTANVRFDEETRLFVHKREIWEFVSSRTRSA
jgi:hypothetical protein